MRTLLHSWLVVAAALAPFTQAGAAEVSRIGTQVENFTLPDFHGQSHSLADFADSKLIVVLRARSAPWQNSMLRDSKNSRKSLDRGG